MPSPIQPNTESTLLPFYAEYGDPKGRPVFYFHGWPGSRLQAALAHDEACLRGLRVIAPDRPGMGRTPPQPGRRLLDWPPRVAALADALGLDRFSLFAVSGGGPYALACAYAFPERLEKVVIACGAPPLAEIKDFSEMITIYRLLLWLKRRHPATLPHLLSLGSALIRITPGSLFLRFLLPLLPLADRKALAQSQNLRIIAESVREAFRHNPRDLATDPSLFLEPWGFSLPNIPIPIHFHQGQRDRNIPLNLARPMFQSVPRSHLTLYPDDGHYSLPLLRIQQLLADF